MRTWATHGTQQTCDCSIHSPYRSDMTGNSCKPLDRNKIYVAQILPSQSTRGLKSKIPPSNAIAYAILTKALGGLKSKIPPSNAIAYAILTKALGGLREKSPREMLSPTRSSLKKKKKTLKQKNIRPAPPAENKARKT